MFHICFAANENYIKYCAVVITSIIKSTDTSKKFKEFFEINNANGGGGDHLYHKSSLAEFKKLDYDSLTQDEQNEGYLFHIISNDISPNSQNKLQALAKDLNHTYPCGIQVHICDESVFQEFPLFLGNHTTYFRFLIPDFMPENVKYCLYLDVDMLVMKDLRELWTLKLEDKVAGATLDVLWWQTYRAFSKNPQNPSFDFKDFYFNAGFLLINLDEWKKQDITKKSIDYLTKYRASAPDQDALCATMGKDKTLILPLEYNCLTHQYYPSLLVDHIVYEWAMPYPREQVEFALNNPVILHWAGDGKPYFCDHWRIDKKGEILGLCWWKLAFQTPIFKDELKKIFATKRENYLICKEFGLYVASLMTECQQSFFGLFKMPFAVCNAFKEFDINKTYALNSKQTDKNLAFELFFIASKAWCRKKFVERLGQFIALPYRAYRAKCRCKKGNFRAQRNSICHKLYTE